MPRQAATPDQFASDEEHNRAERDYWRRSLNVSKNVAYISFAALLFAVIASIAAWRAMEATQEQARIARASLIAAERPWLKVESVNVTGLAVDDSAVVVWAQVTAKNAGHSPAQDVFLDSELLLADLDGDKAAAVRGICDAARQRPSSGFRHIIFPEDAKRVGQQTGSHIFSRHVADVAKAREARLRRRFDEVSGVLGEAAAREAVEEAASYPFYTPLTLAGCITYTSAPTPLIYQTAFLIDLWRRHPALVFAHDGSDVRSAFDMTAHGRVPVEDIIVSETQNGAFAR